MSTTIDNVDIRYLQDEKTKQQFYAAFVTKNDLYDLADTIKSESQLVKEISEFTDSDSLKYFDVYDISRKEDFVIKYMTTYDLLNKAFSKIKKQIENIYSPLLKLYELEYKEVDLPIYGDTLLLTQNIKVKTKFNYFSTQLELKKTLNDLETEEDLINYMNYLETTAGFNIAKTSLEKTLKSKGILDKDIESAIKRFAIVETTISEKHQLPIIGNYNPNERIKFVMTDITHRNSNNTTYMVPEEIIDLYAYIQLTLESTKSLYNKILLLLKSEEIKTVKLSHITFINIERNKVKMTGLFKDSYGNQVDVVSELAKMFRLNEEEINTFVNSRKRSLIPFYKSNEDIPTYTIEEIAFDSILNSVYQAKARR